MSADRHPDTSVRIREWRTGGVSRSPVDVKVNPLLDWLEREDIEVSGIGCIRRPILTQVAGESRAPCNSIVRKVHDGIRDIDSLTPRVFLQEQGERHVGAALLTVVRTLVPNARKVSRVTIAKVCASK